MDVQLLARSRWLKRWVEKAHVKNWMSRAKKFGRGSGAEGPIVRGLLNEMLWGLRGLQGLKVTLSRR